MKGRLWSHFYHITRISFFRRSNHQMPWKIQVHTSLFNVISIHYTWVSRIAMLVINLHLVPPPHSAIQWTTHKNQLLSLSYSLDYYLVCNIQAITASKAPKPPNKKLLHFSEKWNVNSFEPKKVNTNWSPWSICRSTFQVKNCGLYSTLKLRSKNKGIFIFASVITMLMIGLTLHSLCETKQLERLLWLHSSCKRVSKEIMLPEA